MQKKSFITMINSLEHFYTDTWEGMEKLGLNADGNAFTYLADMICEALEWEVDPDRLAAKDDYCYDSGSFIFEYLFNEGEFADVCKNADELWEYIQARYKAAKEAQPLNSELKN